MSREADTAVIRQMFDDVQRGLASAIILSRQYDVDVPPDGFPLRGRDDVAIEALPGARLNLFCRQDVDVVFPFGNLRRAVVEPFYLQVYDERPAAARVGGAVRSVLDLATIETAVGAGYSSRCRIGPLVVEGNRALAWGVTLGTQKGARDVNNEWHHLDGVEINNYLAGAYYQTGGQCKENRLTSPRFAGNDTGKVGVYVAGGTVHVDGAGRIGGNAEADIVLRWPDGEPMSFTRWNSEGSARLLHVYDSPNGCPIEIAGVRWAHNKLHADGAAILLRGPVALELHASQLGDNEKRDAAGQLVVPRIRVEHPDASLEVRGMFYGARGSSVVDPIDWRVPAAQRAEAEADVSNVGAVYLDDGSVRRRAPAFERPPRWVRPGAPPAPIPTPGPRPMRTRIADAMDILLGRPR